MEGSDRERGRAALERAKARLDTLDLYPEPVRIDRVRFFVTPRLFRLPLLRRYSGVTLWRSILFKLPPGAGASDDLVTHELCHIWQGQHRRLALILSFPRHGYKRNPFEIQAREAVVATRPAPEA